MTLHMHFMVWFFSLMSIFYSITLSIQFIYFANKDIENRCQFIQIIFKIQNEKKGYYRVGNNKHYNLEIYIVHFIYIVRNW